MVLSIFASYFFAMTVVPLFCAKFIRLHGTTIERADGSKRSFFTRFETVFNEKFQAMLNWYEGLAMRAMQRPGFTTAAIFGGMAVLLSVTFPFLGRAYFPRTDPGQFVIDVRMPSGTRLEVSNDYIAKVEDIIRSVVKPKDLGMIVSNIGVYPDLSAIYTTNASMDTAFVQTSLKEDHSIGSYEYMRRVQEKLSREMPELSTYFQAGGLVDGVINQGLPAPIDIQIKSKDMDSSYALATQLAAKIKAMPNVSSVYIPQSIDYPGLALNIDRERASLIGLSAQGCGRQRDHRAHLRRHGGAQLLDRSEERQQLHGHGAVREQLDRQHVDGGHEEHSAARRAAGRLQPDAGGRAGGSRFIADARRRSTRRATCRWARWPTSNRSTRPPKWITTRFAA